MEDMILVCVRCEEEFEFSALEQEKYEDRGYDIPKRCPTCRKHKYRNMDAMDDRRHTNKKREYSSKNRNADW